MNDRAAGPVPADHGQAAAAPQRLSRGLANRLLLLTILFVMIAEVLLFVPSIANMRLRWLEARLDLAAAASVFVAAESDAVLAPETRNDLLATTDMDAIVVREATESRIIAAKVMPRAIDLHVDLQEFAPLAAIRDAFDTLFFGGERTMRVYGPAGREGATIEIIMDETPLRTAMLVYSRNVAAISFIISLITAGLVLVTINAILIRPVRRMTRSMLTFAANPESPSSIIAPSPREDEIGVAERELSDMQTQLQKTLREQQHLASLGLAVSKINHDMRNILASAQLLSDRLGAVEDPAVQRFAPKLLRTLDRAVTYSESVLAYGKAQEEAPKRRRLVLNDLVEEVRELVLPDQDSPVEFRNEVPRDLEIDADSEQLFRVLHNLCRNAVQALCAQTDTALVRRLSISAERSASVVTIHVRDTGPGMPAKARENLFTPFRGAARSGGTGLGLAVAHELVRNHGGTIALCEEDRPGTCFRITLPDQPVFLSEYRKAAGDAV